MATVTVLQLSDTHFRQSASEMVNGRDPAARLDRVMEAFTATGLQADLIILTGDNADDGSPGACRRLAAAVGSLGAPVLAIAGNHDQSSSVSAAFGGTDTARVGVWQVIGLASERPGQTQGTLDVAGALARIDQLTATEEPATGHAETATGHSETATGPAPGTVGTPGRPTILAIHHPPRSASTHPWFQLDGAEELLDGLAVRPHVRAVISGHLHEAFELVAAGGLALLGGPSTLYAIHHHDDRYELAESSPTGARVLRLADDGTLTSSLVVA